MSISDHHPIMVSLSNDVHVNESRKFWFESAWLTIELRDFGEVVMIFCQTFKESNVMFRNANYGI